MNPNELMLGDWILFGDKPVQVTSDLFLPGHFTSSYKPIPLTEEIMEKSGFREYYGEYEIRPMTTWCNGFLSEHDITFCEIRYVHQLQHALRLCDIEKEVVV